MFFSTTLILIIISATILLIVGRIIYYHIYVKPEKIKYEHQLYSYRPIILSDFEFKQDFIEEIENYKNSNNVIDSIEKNVKELPIPIPSEPNSIEKGEDIIKKLTTLIDKNSLAFVGTEQLLLDIFPPEQIGNFLIYSFESFASHASQATIESIASLKASIAEGVSNIQNPDIIIDCLKHFSAGIMDYLHNPIHAHNLVYAIDHENFAKILNSFVNWHTVSHGLEPAMNLNQHFSEIGLSWSNHTHDAISNIGDHFDTAIHPDPTGHFPFITLIFSGVREISLINDGKTSIENSLKNVALDVAGTGIGAVGGAKGGAIIGGLIGGPLGALIGGAIGGIAGAIGGRAITNEIKKEPLNNALNDYRTNFESMTSDTKNCAIDAVNKIRFTAIDSKETYLANIGVAPRYDKDFSEIKIIIKRMTQMLNNDIELHTNQLDTFKKSKFSSRSKYKKILNYLDLQVFQIKSKIPTESQIATNPISSIYSLINISYYEKGEFHSELYNSLNDLHKQNVNIRTMVIMWSLNAGKLYQNSIYKVASELKSQAENYNNKCSYWKRVLSDKEMKVNIEKNKLGIN
jgi:hypothetical protein